MKILIKTELSLVLMIIISGCSSFAYTNTPLDPQKSQLKDNRAQLNIERDRGEDGTLFILALSGGGSRAAYFSAEVMLALQNIMVSANNRNLLQSIDAVSSVSGGSLPSAYYAISKDPDDKTKKVISNRVWDRKTVEDIMSRNYIARWIANWFWPDNIALYWTTAYDRSDIMAQTFADNMYDTSIAGVDLKFKDINPERPYIIINSTSGTSTNFGEAFTFTDDDFQKLGSDISDYHISRAVMASASFPAVFNYMTLYNFKHKGKSNEYLHVFDGGNVDNLGLDSTRRIISMKENDKYKNIVILLVDAFTRPQGVPTYEYDARTGINYAVDFNFLDSTDSLLKKVRKDTLESTQQLVEDLEKQGKQAVFYHLSFGDIAHFKDVTMKVKEYDLEKEENVMREKLLIDVLNNIPTNFNITDDNMKAISKAVEMLVTPENDCIKKIQNLLTSQSLDTSDSHCTWPTSDISLAKTKILHN